MPPRRRASDPKRRQRVCLPGGAASPTHVGLARPANSTCTSARARAGPVVAPATAQAATSIRHELDLVRVVLPFPAAVVSVGHAPHPPPLHLLILILLLLLAVVACIQQRLGLDSRPFTADRLLVLAASSTPSLDRNNLLASFSSRSPDRRHAMPSITAKLKAGALASLALVALAQQASGSKPRLNRIDVDLHARDPSLHDNLPLFTDGLLDSLNHRLLPRQSQETQDSIRDQSAVDPIAAAQAADALPNVANNAAGGTDTTGNLLPGDGYSNFAWNQNVPFIPSAATNGSDETGWQELPDTPGFILNRTFSVHNVFKNESGVMPFYISTVADPTKVLRAIVVWPGKPRDIWKYANLMLNARNVAVTNFNQQGVTNDSFVIVAPAMLNQLDLQAGAARPNEIVFHGSSWQRGAPSRNPPMKHAVTSYAAVDQIIDDLFNRTSYPNLNQVVVAGHSMGGQATQRYALMKKTKVYDNNVRFWIGNPGSWAWLTDARPYSNASCAAGNEYDTWPYGLNGNQTKLTSYARKDVIANKTYVIDRFLNRQVSYALALLDIGAGDTHCQARWQGGNHLDRGSQFVLQYQNASSFYLNGKFPPRHTLDYIANVSHQDYAMYSTNMSLQRLFYDGLMVRNADVANTTNPGDKKNSTRPKGAKAFATPAHEKVAIGLLAGSLGLLFIVFTALPIIFTADHVKDVDMSWDSQSYLSTESRRMLVDRKW
ncbi:hypothetical protein PANT_20d00082 [Moesziomyces antarcticus T-34]|uniref:Uncharacterized protein n=1 Tax=Pseudozyma antarctica (strain T-34) TaxID=1151754 RepID=M9MFP2_PSEA3|nr:hypothetical protein PANT_20d00082 [Moesziomyces antarcticus T-34]